MKLFEQYLEIVQQDDKEVLAEGVTNNVEKYSTIAASILGAAAIVYIANVRIDHNNQIDKLVQEFKNKDTVVKKINKWEITISIKNIDKITYTSSLKNKKIIILIPKNIKNSKETEKHISEIIKDIRFKHYIQHKRLHRKDEYSGFIEPNNNIKK